MSKMSKAGKEGQKPLPIGIKLIVILILSGSVVALGVSVGVLFTASEYTDLAETVVITALMAVVAFASFFILLADYKKGEIEKNLKWYIDKFCVILIPVVIMMALILIARGQGIAMTIGFGLLPFIGIFVTPNIVGYALKDMKEWEKIFYDKGNLKNFRDDMNFYRIRQPLPFERKLYWVVVKDQILNIGTVVAVLVIIAICALAVMLYPGQRYSTKGEGVLFFILLAIVVFGIPILSYYVTNAAYKLRIIRCHKYIAYHAIVKSVRDCKLQINQDGRHYKYDYCTCVGIRPKNVHDMKAIMVFIPDDLLLFPADRMISG